MFKVSVIIPTYNRARYICRAINSVLDQTFTDYEIIVVDDGSTDNTREVLAPYGGKIVYIPQTNQGVSAARNKGIEQAKGEYIAFLDSDDYWMPEKLIEQVKILDANPRVGIVYCRMPIINAKGEKIGMKPAGVSGRNLQELLEVGGDIPTSTVMIRRECFSKAGMFDRTLSMGEDMEMWMRTAQFYDLYEIENKVLAHYCRHTEQVTQDKVKVFSGLIQVSTKILKNFPTAPHKKIHARRAIHTYMLSRTYYDLGQYIQAWQHLSAVLIQYPLMGITLTKKSDAFFKKCFIMIKPYAYWMICSAKAAGEWFKRRLWP